MLNKTFLLVISMLTLNFLTACSQRDEEVSEVQPKPIENIANAVDEDKPHLTYNNAVYCAGSVHMLGDLPEFNNQEDLEKYEAEMYSEAIRLSESIKKEDGSSKTAKDVDDEVGEISTKHGMTGWAIQELSPEDQKTATRKEALKVKESCLPYLREHR